MVVLVAVHLFSVRVEVLLVAKEMQVDLVQPLMELVLAVVVQAQLEQLALLVVVMVELA
jgi:hypothetical protein